MIPVLETAAKDGRHHLVTGGELWFFLSNLPLRVWTLPRNKVVTKPRRDIQTAKCMFTVMWNPLGFHMINDFPTGASLNNEYFTTNILARLEEKTLTERITAHAKRLIVHMDNCRIRASGATEDYIKQSNKMRLQHPTYSPDLALGDVHLFLSVKKVEEYSDGRRRRFMPSTARPFESDSNQRMAQSLWRLD
jgi:hypothetical protein